jgi:hypothetical protein
VHKKDQGEEGKYSGGDSDGRAAGQGGDLLADLGLCELDLPRIRLEVRSDTSKTISPTVLSEAGRFGSGLPEGRWFGGGW